MTARCAHVDETSTSADSKELKNGPSPCLDRDPNRPTAAASFESPPAQLANH